MIKSIIVISDKLKFHKRDKDLNLNFHFKSFNISPVLLIFECVVIRIVMKGKENVPMQDRTTSLLSTRVTLLIFQIKDFLLDP